MFKGDDNSFMLARASNMNAGKTRTRCSDIGDGLVSSKVCIAWASFEEHVFVRST